MKVKVTYVKYNLPNLTCNTELSLTRLPQM